MSAGLIVLKAHTFCAVSFAIKEKKIYQGGVEEQCICCTPAELTVRKVCINGTHVGDTDGTQKCTQVCSLREQ